MREVLHADTKSRTALSKTPRLPKPFLQISRVRQIIYPKARLAAHHREKHEKSERWVCQEPRCSKSYSRKDSFSYHHRTIHVMCPKFQCDYPGCEKSYVGKQALKEHLGSGHSERFNCVFSRCGKSYARSLYLKNHARNVHSGLPPEFCCKFPQYVMTYAYS